MSAALIEGIARLHLQPGDVLVVKAAARISDEMGQRVTSAVTAATAKAGWAVAPPILILDAGVTLGVVSEKPDPSTVAALRALVEACETAFGGDEMSAWADEDSVGGGVDREMAITFGHIRAGRAELDRLAQ